MLNAFTEPQLEVIRDLAGCFFDCKSASILEGFSSDIKEAGRNSYIEAIINGLVDPTIWGADGDN